MAPNLEQIYVCLTRLSVRFDCLDFLILHSDQGWQYQHYGYRKRLEEARYYTKHVSQRQLS